MLGTNGTGSGGGSIEAIGGGTPAAIGNEHVAIGD